ncbi:glutathione S-transferase [Acetobacter nitrogenifigens DSM 23921 = NBRC 105050]|uniref:Thiol:disulfide oxidoreductase n=1 Tax=Acetobacter nitrogenifigens DSM 23921 = NBRC 105050 TaxID=1120919 RepID=A0A511XBA9_9PROT|nr:glutathione S-transferase family protein [Acetobacter nitrogenifigens]GBQ93022.1 glutathione S-transferase [Acetobacter nitrogenifigens DSM 23921 = NBRC 105050]GEN60195.1 thiol:disulfide oxidoreductase [Acetobacter nitrogenifigens DSM 23921 = NBRC 105050]
MLDVYAFSTPNSIKVLIALEELELDYELHNVNVRQGEQKAPDFLALNPNAKVPVLVDSSAAGHRFILTESAAILVYLSEKTGKLLPVSGDARFRTFEQLFFHASGLSPAFGQAGFFQRQAAEPQPLAIGRFSSEAARILGILNGVLAKNRFVAGENFTIADIAHFGWLWRREFAGVTLDAAPDVARWFTEVGARPAVQRAIRRVTALAPES